jgi:diaminohydroxyphosphoribosylaminopyrimidine deaminase/5-amino-6-(5-phosphoribosylamino)uracil reductase
MTRCVIATQDPNPLVAGQGIERLRAANIEVTLGVLQQPARDLNDAFAHFIQHRTPFVTLKAALSADGKLAPLPDLRYPNQPHWLTGPAARDEVQRLRHTSDAVVTGIGTVLADDPQLTDRSGILGPNNLPRRPLLRVILDTHLRIPLDSQLVRSVANASDWRSVRGSASARGSDSDLLILCGISAPSSKAAALGSLGVEVDQVPDHNGRLSLPAVLSALAERDILSLLLECGSHLNGGFLRQKLVDKAVLFYAPTKLGDQAIPFAEGIASPHVLEKSLTRITRTTYGPDTCITGYLHDPWQPVSIAH